MKNNTKLIMETWRRFLKENTDEDETGTYRDRLDILNDEPDDGYFHDDYNASAPPVDVDAHDNPIQGEPPFQSSLPPSDPDMVGDMGGDMAGDNEEDTTLSLIRQGAPAHIVDTQAEREGLSPDKVEELRRQFSQENQDAGIERLDSDYSHVGDDGTHYGDGSYDPDEHEVYKA